MKALGLEPEDASAPVNYKVYSDAEITKMLNVTPYLEFEQKFTEMPKEQQLRLADMAADLKLRDDKKIGLIKKTLGIDIDKEIAFINSMKEE